MKIAFVDNLPVGGGLSRYSLGLCKNLTNKWDGFKKNFLK